MNHELIIFGIILGGAIGFAFTAGYFVAMRSVVKQIEQLRELTKQSRSYLKHLKDETTPIYDSLYKEFNDSK